MDLRLPDRLPSGTVTLLFTDIEGSTRLLRHLRESYAGILADHRRLIREAFVENGGIELETQGDAFYVAFGRARDAVLAAAEAQRRIASHPWPNSAEVRVRMGIHTGEPASIDGRYVGLDVHRASRICSAGHGGQVLLSQSTKAVVQGEDVPGLDFLDLGEHRLKDLPHSERLFQLVVPGLPQQYPPLRMTQPTRSGSRASESVGRPATDVVGREVELDAITHFLDKIPTGPSILLLSGPGGIGKTTLYRAALRLATMRAFIVLSAAAGQFETEMSFTVLGDLLGLALPDILPRLPLPQRWALERALLLTDVQGPPLDQRTLSVAGLEAFRLLTDSGPVLVALDDLQWIDTSSARVLEFISRRLEPLPVGILGAVRAGATPRVRLERSLPDDQVKHLDIGPLPVKALAQIFRSHLNTRFPKPTLLQLEHGSGGNPLFALELARALLRLDSRPGLGEPLPIPSNLRELIADRLARLSPSVRGALAVVAVLSNPTRRLVEAATDDSASVLDEAVDADLIEIEDGNIHFAHPLLASAVYADLGSRRRRQLHRRVAEVVDDPEERARHLALSAEDHDAEIATAIDEAARKARGRGAPDAAAVLIEQAIRFTPPERIQDANRRRIEGADCHLAAGDSGQARRLLEKAVADLPPGSDRARSLHRLARVRLYEDDYEAARGVFEEALKERKTDASLQAAIERDLSLAFVQVGRLPEAAPHAEAALRLAEGVGDSTLLAEALAQVANLDFLLGRGLRTDLLKRARDLNRATQGTEVEQDPSYLHRDLNWGVLLKWADDFDGGRSILARLHEQATQQGEETLLPPVLFHLGELECWAGRWDAAADYARELFGYVERSRQPVMEQASLTLTALVHSYRGRTDEATSTAERGLATSERAKDHRFMIRNLKVLGFVALSQGDYDRAVDHLARATELEERARYGDPSIFRLPPELIEALIGVGNLQRAEVLVRELEDIGTNLDRPWARVTGARCRGLLVAALGDLSGAMEALELALKEHDRLPQPFELGRTWMAIGMVQRRSKRKRPARDALERAVAIFEPLGARVWVERARGELSRIGGRAPSPLALTPTEERVVELAANGLTNREIAEQLFMSVRTVESHLTKVFQKTGLTSRRELRRRGRSSPGSTGEP